MFLLKLRAKYLYFARNSRLGVFVLVLLAGAVLPVSVAQASIFSNLKDWWSGTSVSVEQVESRNSQTIGFLEAATNVDPNPAKGGGDITIIDNSALISDSGPSGTIADISNDRQGRASLYVVHRGDTILQIAKMFDVNISTILWANDMSRDSVLREGQTLIILPVSGVQHTVKKGDTVESIAKKYKGDADDIRAFNNLSVTASLAVGDVVIVPDGEESSPVPTSNPTKKSSSGGTASRFAGLPSYKGYYVHPLPTMRAKTQGIHGYNGVDLGAPKGDTVIAAADGVVVVSHFRPAGNPWFGGYGNYIIIEHPNGTQTLYAHLSAVYVSEGAHVSQAQPIGEVGSTGKSTGPHLHFEVRGAKNPF